RAVQDGVLGAEEVRDLGLQLLVTVLGATDEAHARHAVTSLVERSFGRGDHLGVARQAQVVVRAKVEHLILATPDLRPFAALDDPLVLGQAGLLDLVEKGGVVALGVLEHRVSWGRRAWEWAQAGVASSSAPGERSSSARISGMRCTVMASRSYSGRQSQSSRA